MGACVVVVAADKRDYFLNLSTLSIQPGPVQSVAKQRKITNIEKDVFSKKAR
jgi:hypothetical protein